MTLKAAIDKYKRALIDHEVNLAALRDAENAVATAQSNVDRNRERVFKASGELRDVILGLPIGTTGGTFGVE